MADKLLTLEGAQTLYNDLRKRLGVVPADIDTELVIQKEIAKLMHNLVSDGIISHFVIADDDVISEKLTR